MSALHDPSSPSILRMAAPLVVSFWMRAGVTLVDTIYAALLGDKAVAAIGLTIPLEFLMIALWVGLSTGLTALLSRAMGAGEGTRIAQAIRAGWVMVSIVSPLFTLFGATIWFIAPRLGLEEGVARGFQVYGTVLIAGSAFTTFWSIIPDSLVKAHQDTRSTMWAGIWTNVINVALNTFFIFVLDWGLFGIALSTVLGRIGGLAYAIARARYHESRRKAAAGESGGPAESAPYRTILHLAVPSSLTFALMATETGLLNALLAVSPNPTEAIAAHSIFYRLLLFAFQPVIATAVALLPFAARRVGQKDFRGIQKGFRQAALFSSIYSLAVVGPLILVLAPWLAERLAESALTVEYTRVALRVVPLACLFSVPFLLCRPVFESMHQGRPGLVMAILRYLVLTGPLAWIGMRTATAMGHPPLYGLLAGTLVAGAIASGIFHLWLIAELKARSGGRKRTLATPA